MKKIISIILSVMIGLLLVNVVPAQSSSVSYHFLIGGGFLCELEESACPDIAMADNGDTISLSGSGDLSVHPKTVSGEGTFVHKDVDGNIKGMGTWTAVQLLSFKSYGSGVAQGLPEEFEGGYAVIRIHITPESGGPGFDAILQVDCLLGSPPAGAHEGIRLAVQDTPFNFNKEVSGDTIFIRE